MRRAAIALILFLAFLVRIAPIVRWETVMGVDAYYHMRLVSSYVVRDTLYAGTRIAAYPPLFHVAMRLTFIPVHYLSLYAPPFISTCTVGAVYWVLRRNARVAALAACLAAVHPALIMRCYFFPELLALLIMPLGYAAIGDTPRRQALFGALMALTHAFSALVFFATSLAWGIRGRRALIPVLGFAATIAFVWAWGPTTYHVPSSRALTPFLYGFGIFLPFSLAGWKAPDAYRPWYYALAMSLLLCVVLTQEVSTHRIAALASFFVCATAAAGLSRVSSRSVPAAGILLVCIMVLSIQYVGDRSPIYLADDTSGAEYLGTISVSPVASTAGHLATYYGSAVLVDEYAQYGADHAQRTHAMLSVIMRGSTDYRVLDSSGVRLLFAESVVTAPTLDNATCLYDGGSRIFLLP